MDIFIAKYVQIDLLCAQELIRKMGQFFRLQMSFSFFTNI